MWTALGLKWCLNVCFLLSEHDSLSEFGAHEQTYLPPNITSPHFWWKYFALATSAEFINTFMLIYLHFVKCEKKSICLDKIIQALVFLPALDFNLMKVSQWFFYFLLFLHIFFVHMFYYRSCEHSPKNI